MSVFDWCRPHVNDHENCKRSYERVYFQDKKLVKTGIFARCHCPEVTCKCHFPDQEAVKKSTRKRKT